MPYDIIYPKIFRTNDTLYSLYVIIRENGHVKLHEISVPDSPLYAYRSIDLESIFVDNIDDLEYGDLNVNDLLIQQFIPGKAKSNFFVLSNIGFHKIWYKNDYSKISIDTIDELKDALKKSLTETIMATHIKENHNDKEYFSTISRKINQFDDDFNAFKLIPTEFKQTQDVGVIPNGKVDDTDESTDHRNDSVTLSTDILLTDGMTLGYDENPGFVSAAISNPATIYDDDNVFIKSQRNSSLEGTEFYDYIYDQDGNQILDLYSVPFIYRVNSNNTYDLYVNVQSTRTKYLNRIAGTLKSDLTS